MKLFDIRFRANYGHGPTQRDVAMRRDLPVRQLFKNMLKINIETESALHDVKRNEAIFRRRYSHLISRVEPLGKGSAYQNKDLYLRAERQLTLRRQSDPGQALSPFNVGDPKMRQRSSSLPRIGSAVDRHSTFVTSALGRRTSCTSYSSEGATETSRQIRRKIMLNSSQSDATIQDHSDDNPNASPTLEKGWQTEVPKESAKPDRKLVTGESKEIIRDNMFIDFGQTTIEKVFNALFDTESETDDQDQPHIDVSSTVNDSQTGDCVVGLTDNEVLLKSNKYVETDAVSPNKAKKRALPRKKKLQIDNTLAALQKCRYLRIPNNPNEQDVKIWRM